MNEAERFLQQYEEKKNAPPPVPPQYAHTPHPPPVRSASHSSSAGETPSLWKDWWSLSGRIGRQLYFLRLLVVLGGCFIFGAVLGLIGAAPLAPVFGLAVVPFMIPQHTRRLHDIGMSGWWQLLINVPFVGFVFWPFVFLKSGTPGPNKYYQ